MATSREIQKLARVAGVDGIGDSPIPSLPPNGIVQFATDHSFLGLDLFPRQGTLLKLLTLDLDSLTDYDRMVVAAWCSGFTLHKDGDSWAYRGENGVPPDILDRIGWCRDQGRCWVREAVLVIGRRGSKSFVLSVLTAWRLWHLLELGDPQTHYQIPSTKALIIPIFSTDLSRARQDAFRDVAGMVEKASCFAPFLGSSGPTWFSLLTPSQLQQGARPGDDGLIVVSATASTATSGRGPASPMIWFDEMAHVSGMGPTADSRELYRSAAPATAQFPDSLIAQSSTPWNQEGQLYESYDQGLAVSPVNGTALSPDTLVVQLASPELYLDADQAHTIPMWPDGPAYPAGLKPKIDYTYVERQLELDPESARIEFLAQFGTVSHPYLIRDRVSAVFQPFDGRHLEQEPPPILSYTYVAHGDPSRSNANFGFAIGHLEEHDGFPHVFFDLITHWDPHEFPDGIIDYRYVNEAIYSYVKQYRIRQLTFDQYSSVQAIQDFRVRARLDNLSWNPAIDERTASARYNDRAYELFKTAVHAGLVHAPRYELARAELEHPTFENGKVVAPTSGPIQTKDLADAMTNVTYTLLHERKDQIFEALAGLPISGSQPGGFRPATGPGPSETPHEQLSTFGRERAFYARQNAVRRAG